MSAGVWIGVALLGGLGAVARFTLDGLASQRFGRSLPFGTLVVNVTGSFLLGLVAGLTLSADASLLLGTATIGSYTTFSTWMLETHRLGEDGRLGPAIANVLVSLAIGVGAAALGRTIGVHV
jgi:fluoride exporter